MRLSPSRLQRIANFSSAAEPVAPERVCLGLLSKEGSKFCAIRRMRTSFGCGAKLAQQERRTMRREERLREKATQGKTGVAVPRLRRFAGYARDDKLNMRG
jgi:hypothetical protein